MTPRGFSPLTDPYSETIAATDMSTPTAPTSPVAPTSPTVPAPSPAPAEPGPAPGGDRAPSKQAWPQTKTAVGEATPRIEAPEKVSGTAPYAYEHGVENPLYLFPVVSTIAKGRISRIDTTAAEAVPGVHRVMTHLNAPRLRIKTLPDLWVLQSDRVSHSGQFIGAVIAENPTAARHAAGLVTVSYVAEQANLVFSREHADTLTPRRVGMMDAGSHEKGDVGAALAVSPHQIDEIYTTPVEFHNPIEPHAVIATWNNLPRTDLTGKRLQLFDANQGPLMHVPMLATLFGLLPQQIEIIAPHVGGSFGTKGWLHPHVVLTALAAKLCPGRPIKYALTRQQMFRTVGYRPASEQRVRLGAQADGRLTALDHEVWAPTSAVRDYSDAVAVPSRMMYAAPARRSVHHTLKLDIPVGVFMRGPGEFQGMFALETAMDELAVQLGVDPIQLRLRNEPDLDPDNGKPFSSRNLVGCLLQGADRFGWADRLAPGQRREGEWLVGMGVAAATFPGVHFLPSRARITFTQGRYVVGLQAADIGTGARTALTQVAADALGVPMSRITVELGRTGLPMAVLAGGSMGTYEWSNAITAVASKFIRKHGINPKEGASEVAAGRQPKGAKDHSRHVFGAHFSQVRVSEATGEVRVDRSLGMFAAGRIINPLTARSQMVGGITMGISGALHEEAYFDPRFGRVANGDLAGYHIAANADIHDIEIGWIEEPDPLYGALGGKGIGEVGIVGVPAAVGNAIYNATGIRLRDLPFTPDKLVMAFASR